MKTNFQKTTLVISSLFWLSTTIFQAFANPASAANRLSGDSNCDGAVNIMDVITTANYIMGNNPQPFCFDYADVNADGMINIADIIGTVNIIMSGGSFICGTSTVTDIDGYVYNTLLIGNQCWMGKNLQTAHYRDGSAIDAWIYDHNLVPGINSDEEMVAIYGRLYSWHAANDAKGICPEGWIVPAIEQWSEMENYLIDNYEEVWGPAGQTGSNAGAALMSCRQVNSPQGGDCATSDHPRWNEPAGNLTSGFDIVGFSSLPAGQVVNGVSQWNGVFNYYWSSSEFSAANGWFTRLGWEWLPTLNVAKIRGYSVRCIKE